jgi:hypothetical protein
MIAPCPQMRSSRLSSAATQRSRRSLHLAAPPRLLAPLCAGRSGRIHFRLDRSPPMAEFRSLVSFRHHLTPRGTHSSSQKSFPQR